MRDRDYVVDIEFGKHHGSTDYLNRSWGFTVYHHGEYGWYAYQGWAIEGNKKDTERAARFFAKQDNYALGPSLQH